MVLVTCMLRNIAICKAYTTLLMKEGFLGIKVDHRRLWEAIPVKVVSHRMQAEEQDGKYYRSGIIRREFPITPIARDGGRLLLHRV